MVPALHTLDAVFGLYETLGGTLYGGEAVTQRDHALQCAACAERNGEPDSVIVAGLLHDYGHLLDVRDGRDARHQDLGADALASLFGPDVTEVIRLHVAAKRFLCGREPGYWDRLSAASRESLTLQGGPFGADEAATFEHHTHAAAAVRVRRYDDLAKRVGAVVPPPAYFRTIAERLVSRPPTTPALPPVEQIGR